MTGGIYMSQKIELLAPAGSLQKLKYAVEYGADAIYIGGEAFCDCPRLTNLAVPAGVTFDGCPERDFGLIMGSYDDIDEDE